MSVIAVFTAGVDEFPLGLLFDTHPEAVVELERVVPTEPVPIPYFWVEEADCEQIESVFRNRADVESVRVLDEVYGECLFRVKWIADDSGILKAIADSHVSLLSAVGTSDGWTFVVRAETAGPIREFRDASKEKGHPVALQRIHQLDSRHTDIGDLTPSQIEALLLAYERGYYQTPRQTTLEEMAADLGITGQSLGARLQRGIHHLIGITLVE